MNKIEYKVSEQYVLQGFPYHDGILNLFNFERGSIKFCLRSLCGIDVEIYLIDVVDFTVKNLWNGTIVSNIFWWDVTSLPLSSFHQGYGYGTLYSERLFENDLERHLGNLGLNNEAFLFEMNGSYGGDIACICKDMTVSIGG